MPNLLLFAFVTFMAWISVYIDGRFNDKYKTKTDYIKVILFGNSVVFGSMYLLNWLSPTGSGVDIIRPKVDKILGDVIDVKGINEKILSGAAPF